MVGTQSRARQGMMLAAAARVTPTQYLCFIVLLLNRTVHPRAYGTRVGLAGPRGVSRVVRSERRSPRNASEPESVATGSRVRRRTRQRRTEARRGRIRRRTRRLRLLRTPHPRSAVAARRREPETDR